MLLKFRSNGLDVAACNVESVDTVVGFNLKLDIDTATQVVKPPRRWLHRTYRMTQHAGRTPQPIASAFLRRRCARIDRRLKSGPTVRIQVTQRPVEGRSGRGRRSGGLHCTALSTANGRRAMQMLLYISARIADILRETGTQGHARPVDIGNAMICLWVYKHHPRHHFGDDAYSVYALCCI